MSKKILLADDSVTIQKVIAITLASEDYALTVVGDGDAAVSKARELKPDLVIADVAMPGKSGYEVCDFLKKDPALKGTPVLLLAGTFEPLNKAEASRVGADDSIIKPFESQELLDKIARLVAAPPAAAAQPARPVAAPQRPAAPSARTAAEPRRPEASRDYAHLSAEEEIAPPEVDKPDLVVSDEHWEPGDFLGFPEAAEEKKAAAEDEGVIGEGVAIQPAAPAERKTPKADDLSAAVAEFTDLEFPEDEFREKAAPVRPAPAEPVAPAEQAEPEPFDLSAFEVEPFKAEPSKAEPPRAVKEERAQRPMAEPVERGAVLDVSETEEIEEEAIPAPPEPPRAATATVEPKPSAWREAERPIPPPLREVTPPRAPEPVRPVELVERVAAVSVPPPAPGPAPEVVRQTAAPQPSAVTAPPQAPMLSEEQVAEIVKKTAREIIERIAWDIVPELAEEFIKVEMKRVRDAIADKFKAGG